MKMVTFARRVSDQAVHEYANINMYMFKFFQSLSNLCESLITWDLRRATLAEAVGHVGES